MPTRLALPLVAFVFLGLAPVYAQRGAGPGTGTRDGAQAPQAGTAVVAGVVVTGNDGNEPVRRAMVTLRSADVGSGRVVVTDSSGRFMFSDLPAGRFTIAVTKPAYVSMNYGARAPRLPGHTIALTDGQQVTGLTIRLPRGAVITGRVIDADGQPASGLRLAATERVSTTDTPSFRFGGAATTDDRGFYRIFGLPAGSYVVAASPPPGFTLGGSPRVTTTEEVQWALATGAQRGGTSQVSPPAPPRGPGLRYTAVFYPGTSDPVGATPVAVAEGEERTSVDFVVQLVPTATLEGTVSRADGQPLTGNVQVMALAAHAIAIPGLFELPPRASVAPDGRFSVSGVAPGRYTLSARAASGRAGSAPGGRAGGPPVLDLWAAVEVDVAGYDITDLTLGLAPGMTVAGRIVVDATNNTAPGDFSTANLRLAPPPSNTASLGVPFGQVRADGGFSFVGVPPGSYYLSAFLPGGAPMNPTWMLKSAVWNGRDVLDTPLEVRPNEDVPNIVVTFSDRVTELAGSLTDQLGRPAPDYFVAAFPTDARHWRQQSRWLRPPTRPASDGRFSLRGLPPGEYYLAAITEFEPTEWFTPGFLQQLVPLSLRLTLREGETTTQDIRLAGS